MRCAVATLLTACLWVAACSGASPLDAMQKGEQGRVVRVIDGDALVLDTGQSVRLVGIEAPALNGRYEDPEPYAEKARRTLEDLVMGRRVQLYYPGLTRDRYDRALAHVVTADGAGPRYWVNEELLRRGAGRLRLYPDTDLGGAHLLEVETEARAAAKGLWGSGDYSPIQAERLPADARGFHLVEGVLGGEATRPAEEQRTILCSRSVQDAALEVDIAFSARPACDVPAGTPVRLRGWINGGRMEFVHPLHLERLETG